MYPALQRSVNITISGTQFALGRGQPITDEPMIVIVFTGLALLGRQAGRQSEHTLRFQTRAMVVLEMYSYINANHFFNFEHKYMRWQAKQPL